LDIHLYGKLLVGGNGVHVLGELEFRRWHVGGGRN
jgi:hypothetical protein